MKRLAPVLLLLAISAGLPAACARPKKILVYTEEYWRAIIDLHPDFRPALEKLSAQHDYSVSYATAPRGTNYMEHLRKFLQGNPQNLIITGPLLGVEVVRFAPLLPHTRFAVLGMPRLDLELPPNVLPVYSRRQNAFREAGRLTAEILSGGNLTEKFGNRVGVIFSGQTQQEEEVLAQFERGFSAVGDADLIVREEIGSSNDRVKAENAINNLINQDIRLFLVKTYGLNGMCLERIINAGGYYIVEDFSSFSLQPERLFLTIEDDFEFAFQEILKLGETTPSSPPILPGKILRGESLPPPNQD